MSEKNKQAPAKDKEDSRRTYHFTSEEGKEGILNSGKIKASVDRKDDDVTFGANKTYFTSLHPEKNTPREVARNNYDGSKQYVNSKLPSTEYAFGCDAKEIDAKRESDSRSIQTVIGDVPLSKVQVVYKREGDGYKKVWSKPEKK